MKHLSFRDQKYGVYVTTRKVPSLQKVLARQPTTQGSISFYPRPFLMSIRVSKKGPWLTTEKVIKSFGVE